THAVLAVRDRLGDFHTAGQVKGVDGVDILDDELDRASLWVRRSLSNEHLHLVEVHAGEGRRLAPDEAHAEPQLFRVKARRSDHIRRENGRMLSVAFDRRSWDGGHDRGVWRRVRWSGHR